MSGELERVTLLEKDLFFEAVMTASGCTASIMRVTWWLRKYWNPEHGVAWPSQERLARECGLSLRSVVTAVKWLEARGFIYTIRRGRANAYAVNWSKGATVKGCNSARGNVQRSAPMKRAEDCTLSKSTGLNPSNEQNLIGERAEGAPQGGPRVAASPSYSQPSPVDNCGRTAEQHEAPEPGFKDRPSWYETQEPDDDLPDLDEAWRQHDERPAPAYAPEPEPELPSRQIERQFGGKPPVGSKVHAIWRLQRRLEGVCRKVGQSPFAITDHSCDEGLEDLLDMQARNDSGLGRVLAEYAALDFHETAEFFQPRGQC